MKSKILLFAAMVLLVMSTACGTPAFPAGVYTRVQPSPTDELVKLDFAQDGAYVLSFYNDIQSVGTYAAAGDNITLNESEGGPCFGNPLTVQWSSNGGELKLKTVKEECSLGLGLDIAGPWTRGT